MAQYYGSVQGARGKVHRLGSPSSGIEVIAASWSGAVRTFMYSSHVDNSPMVRIETIPWNGNGAHQLLFDGPLSVMQAGATPPNVIGGKRARTK